MGKRENQKSKRKDTCTKRDKVVLGFSFVSTLLSIFCFFQLRKLIPEFEELAKQYNSSELVQKFIVELRDSKTLSEAGNMAKDGIQYLNRFNKTMLKSYFTMNSIDTVIADIALRYKSQIRHESSEMFNILSLFDYVNNITRREPEKLTRLFEFIDSTDDAVSSPLFNVLSRSSDATVEKMLPVLLKSDHYQQVLKLLTEKTVPKQNRLCQYTIDMRSKTMRLDQDLVDEFEKKYEC